MRYAKVLVLLLVSLAAIVGCDQKSTPASQPITINGAGATFPHPMYSKWFDEYHKSKPDIQFNYQPIGSGGGIRQVTDGTVDFGATDGPMNDEQIAAFQDKRKTAILHFPTVLGAAVPAYNIPDVTAELNFTPEALAGIYLGTIKKWNDPAIAKANPGVKLPAAEIVVIHRSDGSGTTYVWTDYLSKISPEWEKKVGKATSVNWPVGLGGKGNDGVSGVLQQTKGAIGYVELIYAINNKMSYGKVRNSSGNFVKASTDSVTAAASGASMPDDFRVSITNAPGKDAYPISSFTWLLVPQSIQDGAKRDDIKQFLSWMLTDGQKMTSALAYAPLPQEVVAKEQQAISKIQ